MEIVLKSDMERSLFGDAKEMTRESSEVNGPQVLLSIKMARHMSRSTLFIHLFIREGIAIYLVI